MDAYYQNDLVTLYHGDCREVDTWLDADVLVTDPPYGMGYVESRSSTRGNAFEAIAGDSSPELRDDVIKKWGYAPALVFGRWNIPRPEGTKQRLVWDKVVSGMGNLTQPFGPQDEEIYVLGPWPSVVPGGRKREGGTPARFGNIVRCQTLNSQSHDRPNHPTPKPVSLMEWLIEKCPPGVIADPFAGSGATLLAAVNQGRKVIGVEFEERYCELIAKRLASQTGVLDFGSAA